MNFKLADNIQLNKCIDTFFVEVSSKLLSCDLRSTFFTAKIKVKMRLMELKGRGKITRLITAAPLLKLKLKMSVVELKGRGWITPLITAVITIIVHLYRVFLK